MQSNLFLAADHSPNGSRLWPLTSSAAEQTGGRHTVLCLSAPWVSSIGPPLGWAWAVPLPIAAPGAVPPRSSHPPAAPVMGLSPAEFHNLTLCLPLPIDPSLLPHESWWHPRLQDPQAIIYHPFQQVLLPLGPQSNRKVKGWFLSATLGWWEGDPGFQLSWAQWWPWEPGPGPAHHVSCPWRGQVASEALSWARAGGEASKGKTERKVVTRPCWALQYILQFENQTVSVISFD